MSDSAPPEPASRWIEPSPFEEASGLTPSQVRSWRERGFALVDGVLPSALLAELRADAAREFPPAGSPESETIRDFGSASAMVFPSASDALNRVTLHPRLLGAVSQLLGVPVRELRLTQSDLWPKYGRGSKAQDGFDNADQRIHMDYPNHTLTHPPPWDTPEAVEIIVYLSDVADCGGATAVVPREGADDPAYAGPLVRMPGVAGLPWINDRESAESRLREDAPEVAAFRAEHLYPRERRARFRVGSVLFYRHDTWHRGTPLERGAMRLAQNLTYRKAGSEWVSVLHAGWSWAMYRAGMPMERLIATGSVEQRCVLGFPPPGHPYWNAETLAAVDARYGPLGFAVSPYEKGL